MKLEPIEHSDGERETEYMGQGERVRETYVDKRAIALVGCAKEYRIKGAPPHELAEHNAKVATSYNRHMVAHVWAVLKLWSAARQRPPAPRRPPPAQQAPRILFRSYFFIFFDSKEVSVYCVPIP
ncbi:hypothetical protein evm_012331 [Chilo suppressalis]|nr:hypothetical protein evm_012331 [Chilo suppressalis]